MSYIHSHIQINNRSLSLQSISNSLEIPSTNFETATFSFIKKWLRGENLFSLQTSGSTGTPKLINVTRYQLEESAKATLQALSLPENSTALVCLNTQYIAGIMMLIRCLVGNLKMEIIEPTASPFEKISPDAEFDFCALVPYQVDEIMERYGIEGIHRIKKIIIGGAPLSYSLQQKLVTSSSEIYLTYGMTETLSHVALQRISGQDRRDFFTALPSIKLSQDERECLIVEAPYLIEKVTTNDIVELLSATTFRWLGRYDNVINSGGVKLFPEKIEIVIAEAFEKLKYKNSFFIYGIPDDKLGTKAILVIEETIADKQSIIKELKDKLRPFEAPKDILFMPRFLRTETGKIKRQKTIAQSGF